MSKNNKWFYDTLDDSSRRLRDTVVMHKNLGPVYVHQVQGLNTDQAAVVSQLPLPKGEHPKTQAVALTPAEFEIRKLPTLGYVDSSDSSFYISRRSARQGKQGICRGNIFVPANTIGRGPTFEQLLCSKSFVKMLVNDYPSFEEVFHKVIKAGEPFMQSFSKTFCLGVDDMESVALYNRGLKVAVANNPKKYGPLFKVPDKFKYLKEELVENRIRLEG